LGSLAGVDVDTGGEIFVKGARPSVGAPRLASAADTVIFEPL
jgi:hypothetical protein